MSQLVEEVELWNTPLIGAYLLWRFTQGYCNNHATGEAPIALLHFIAVAILTSNRLVGPITNKRDNLQSYVRSFDSTQNADLLLTIQERIKEKKEYVLSAIDIAIAENLLVWEYNTGKLYPCKAEQPVVRGKGLRKQIRLDGDKAEILGKWFSKHSVSAIAAYLKVVF